MAKQKTNVMAGYSGEMEDILRDVLQDNLSPEAAAAIATHLDSAVGRRQKVAREVAWFRALLIEMVGVDEYEGICSTLTW